MVTEDERVSFESLLPYIKDDDLKSLISSADFVVRMELELERRSRGVVQEVLE